MTQIALIKGLIPFFFLYEFITYFPIEMSTTKVDESNSNSAIKEVSLMSDFFTQRRSLIWKAISSNVFVLNWTYRQMRLVAKITYWKFFIPSGKLGSKRGPLHCTQLEKHSFFGLCRLVAKTNLICRFHCSPRLLQNTTNHNKSGRQFNLISTKFHRHVFLSISWNKRLSRCMQAQTST